MKTFFYAFALVGMLSCRPDPASLFDPTAPTESAPLAEFSVEGIGRVPIDRYSNNINITLPSGFKSESLRIAYRLGSALMGGSGAPASGSVIYFRGRLPTQLCLRKTGTGSCEASYIINVSYTDPVQIEPVPASFERTIDDAFANYTIRFLLTNYGTVGTRRFRIRFTNPQTGVVHESDNWSFDGLSKPVSQPDTLGKTSLTMGGSFPLKMGAGQYNVEVIVTNPPNRTSGPPEEVYAIKQPFILKAGRPFLIGIAPATPITSGVIAVLGRNLTSATVSSIRIGNDFSQPQTAQGQFVNDTLLRFNVAAGTPAGVYVAEASLEGGKPMKSVFALTSSTTRNYFAYAAPYGNFAKTYSMMADLSAMKAGDSLEVRYNVVNANGRLVPDGQQEIPASSVALIRVDNPTLRYALKPGIRFVPSYNVPYMYAWKWTIPADVQKGDYQLIFQDAAGNNSLPHYRKLTII